MSKFLRQQINYSRIALLSLITLSCSETSNENQVHKNVSESTSAEALPKVVLNECMQNLIDYHKSIHFKTLKELDNTKSIRRVTYKNATGVMTEGIYIYNKLTKQYLDGVCQKLDWIDSTHAILYGETRYFYDKDKFIFGFFEYNPKRERLDVFPRICDTTGLIINKEFYYIDSLGKIVDYNEFTTHFQSECLKPLLDRGK